jgi:hypothetical protein
MKAIRPLAVTLALCCGAGAASAQTIIHRQIADEPVETTVTQDYSGTYVTRRPLGPGGAPVVQRQIIAPAEPVYDRRRVIIESEEDVADEPVVRQRVYAPARAPIVAATERPVRRTERRVAVAPVVLSQPQRRIIRQTIEEQVVSAPRERYRSAPVLARGGDYDDDFDTSAPRPPLDVPYTIGTRLPSTVATYGMPARVVTHAPAVQSYNYAVVGGRTYLVEPGTGVVVADLTQ